MDFYSNSKVHMKWISIDKGVGGSIYTLVKTTSNGDPKDKGKNIQVKQTEEEKKWVQAIEIERQRQINNILRQRANDPPGVNKGDPNKQWCYETIEIVVLAKNDEFLKKAQEKL